MLNLLVHGKGIFVSFKDLFLKIPPVTQGQRTASDVDLPLPPCLRQGLVFG